MRQEISVSTVFTKISTDQSVIGTHSGIFHADDVIAVALFCIGNASNNIHVVRSRNPEELSKCDILVDVGGGMYDHHQVGGNGSRENGIPYASAGLYWKFNGRDIIKMLSAKHFQAIMSEEDINSVFYSLDKILFQEIDKIDNGIPARSTVFDYIPSYLPSWRNLDESQSIYEDCFKAVLEVSISILTKTILSKIDKVSSFNYILNLHKQEPDCRILQIPAQSFPWLSPVVMMNKEFGGHIDFVMFEYPSGGWAAQCVPPSLEQHFEQRVPFPAKWAGQADALSAISGIEDATFCHNGRFFVRANSKEAIIEMCNTAIKSV